MVRNGLAFFCIFSEFQILTSSTGRCGKCEAKKRHVHPVTRHWAVAETSKGLKTAHMFVFALAYSYLNVIQCRNLSSYHIFQNLELNVGLDWNEPTKNPGGLDMRTTCPNPKQLHDMYRMAKMLDGEWASTRKSYRAGSHFLLHQQIKLTSISLLSHLMGW